MTKNIAFANTLKSVDDVRTFEKLAQTIAKTNKYEVNIIGNTGKKESNHKSIQFHPNSVSRKSWVARFSVRWKTLALLLKINPDILIIGTHELLDVVVILKILRGTRVIYDVQENYKKNILYLSNLPIGIRQIAANLLRSKEVLSSPCIDTFWLAEKCYFSELQFAKKRGLVIENKASKPIPTNRSKQQLSILFSGTISHYSEILLAIQTYQHLKKRDSKFSLKIIGQCHDKNLWDQIKSNSNKDPGIQLNISTDPISHQDILAEISSAYFGIVSYQENEVNRNKIPTKLYEYSRHRLPFLIQCDTFWAKKAEALGGAIPIDFSDPNIDFIFDMLRKKAALFPTTYPQQDTWEAQEATILDSIENLSFSH